MAIAVTVIIVYFLAALVWLSIHNRRLDREARKCTDTVKIPARGERSTGKPARGASGIKHYAPAMLAGVMIGATWILYQVSIKAELVPWA